LRPAWEPVEAHPENLPGAAFRAWLRGLVTMEAKPFVETSRFCGQPDGHDCIPNRMRGTGRFDIRQAPLRSSHLWSYLLDWALQ
jgi:hypothetical protein